ncbi:MAG: hypothetical protein J6D08_10170 [Lachnospiraceae bacterium]|nr:hypothetical protein [Lachnospiraceae bacterium]
MKNKIVMNIMLLALTAFCTIGCSKSEEPTEIVTLDLQPQSEVDGNASTEPEALEPQTENAPQETFVSVQVENPGWDYYCAKEGMTMEEQSVHLEKLSETANGISSAEEWIAANQLDFQKMPYSDELYTYSTYGYNAFDTYELQLQELFGDRRTISLNFSDYNYADDFVEAERDFVFQRIIWAKAEEGILYAATGHYTYAASSPHNAYITAIDLEDYHIIWKTEPLTCNSLSFEVIDDAIVCGYGFTSEDDYLYILDRKTGLRQEEIPLKTAAEYIFQKDGILYVKTYDTDYTFKISR